MGSLIGHVGPGLGFLVIGLWHLYNNLRLLALQGPSMFKSRTWFPTSRKHGLPRQFELYLIISGGSLAVAMELFISPAKHQPLDTDWTIPTYHLHNFEHASISLSFIAYALCALAIDKWAASPRRSPLPAQHDLLFFLVALSFAQEFLMFHLHSSDHMGVEGQYHWLLQFLAFVSLLTTIPGFGRVTGSFAVAFVRSMSLVFQGVWFILMGFALWTPGLMVKGCFMHVVEGRTVVGCHGEESLNRAKALVNIIFSWILILLAVFAALFYLFIMIAYGNATVKYSAVSEEEEDEDDVETPIKSYTFAGIQGFVNSKVADHKGSPTLKA